ncbi:hypothetical protein [Roseibium sp.]|uniref:hypothetical protein n=1 Tax=Roseibium sp. TaxID=1936156 RepID=UPI003A97C9A4
MKHKIPAHVRKNMEKGRFQSTVGSSIRRVFPEGTAKSLVSDPSWHLPPGTPQDIFAATGLLLEDSGALAFFGAGLNRSHKEYPKLFLDSKSSKEMQEIGKKWSQFVEEIPNEISILWEDLFNYWEFPLNHRAYKFNKERKRNDQYWWLVAYKLFVISDTACNGIGFTPFDLNEKTFAGNFWRLRVQEINQRKKLNGFAKNVELQSSLAPRADPDVVCVQPKSLVPTLGAGTRVFSRNLALLRPRGLVRTQWSVQTSVATVETDPGLNILVIPFPYDYEKNEFDLFRLNDETTERSINVFRLKQSWLEREKFSKFLSVCSELIRECIDEHGKSVHAIALPELALNQKSFEEFSVLAKKMAPSLEFIISGSSENCEPQPKKGNYIWIRKYVARKEGRHSTEDGFFDISQSKHHRWKLDGGQILDYSFEHGADGGLSELESYWENFSGRAREVNFLAFRQNSAFCGVVCEDLARSEPCHEIIRSVGPNLLFGLLMDGPQIEQRWGAKYASLFAADHGCAVMTISSRALVAKSQEKRETDKNFSVLYFRSPYMKNSLPFECPDPNSAVFLRLVPDTNAKPRLLIDGREKSVVDWVLDRNFHPRIIKSSRGA